jgi:bifunctional non-homologous end joining protein LigD
MGLQRYREKRDFAVTPEPKGTARSKTGFSYVIQKHAASHLHYDFRLEQDGVLLSWAVPKGPSLDPKVRRLAMQTEDHPIEYGGFEGTIPQGEYGGGTVMVWDQGTWEPLEDPKKGYARGHLRFALHGKKLRGHWHLVRTGRADAQKKSWLLFKSRDDEARTDVSIVEEQQKSALTGRTMDQIASARGKVWHSNREPKGARAAVARSAAARPASRAPSLEKRAVRVRMTNPERVLYPREGITKRELAEYYAAVAPWMIPHVAGRPLMLVRCPQGVDKQRFVQKHVKPPLPDGIRAVPIEEDGAEVEYVAIDDALGLVGLAQMSVLEIHTWGAHADDPDRPDFLVFDLDPDPKVKWTAVIAGARLLREALGHLGLESYVKTTGGKGLHVCVPIARRVGWEEAKEFCRALTELVVKVDPKAYVATMSKAQRSGKIFIDFFRNGRGATFIAPYSTRARHGAPVAMPLAWDELSPKIAADHFHLRNVMKRLSTLGADPWKDASSKKQVLSAAAIRSVLKPPKRR